MLIPLPCYIRRAKIQMKSVQRSPTHFLNLQALSDPLRYQGQKRSSDPPELEIQMFVNYHVGAENQAQVPCTGPLTQSPRACKLRTKLGAIPHVSTYPPSPTKGPKEDCLMNAAIKIIGALVHEGKGNKSSEQGSDD
ncbi:hypothetical protein STEG23_002511, partial [Scotinomys teguina]